jgi:uncharacterized protein YdiU (UPF0061 family)
MSLFPPLGPAVDLGLAWTNRFHSLGDAYCVPRVPTPLASPYWVGVSLAAAHEVSWDSAHFQNPEVLQALVGNAPIAGSDPIASVYSGHQFGQWAGQLGDGRAILLGESNGLEIQLKGAGLTPFSRMGDGRAVLRSSIREFLASEAMHALGIPTTRALCVAGSDAPVRRESMETAAVVTRLAPSFIRFGHFEHFCHHGLHGELRRLADFVIENYHPHIQRQALSEGPWAGQPYVALLAAVTERTAEMIAHWQAVGFCHGVMNTDNMSILGLTMDYGPFQFMDAYDPGHICNHSDSGGRYAYFKQPHVAYWNLFCLGQAMMPLIDEQDAAIAALETFKSIYPRALAKRMACKLGFDQPCEGHSALIENVLALLASDKVDFTIFWRRLSYWVRDGGDASAVRDLFLDRHGFDTWLLSYSEHLSKIQRSQAAELMLRTNPKFVLRNHLGQQAIDAARQKDFTVVADLLRVLESPFDEHPEFEAWADFPPEWASGISISCSS